jgi:nicotinamide riboside transporter PnuC
MTWTWALTILSIAGVTLNIKKHRASYIIWICTNFCWAIVDFSSGLPAQGALFTVYFFLSIWGLIEWTRSARNTSTGTTSKR